LAVTLPALTGEFVWDDRWLILASPLRQDPGLLLPVVFEGHGWGTMNRPEITVAYFRPLANLVHGILLIVFGAHPLPFRILSSLLHAGCALALGLYLRGRHPRAAWGAVVFAVHPITADAFGWVSAAPDLMAAGFLLATLLALERPRAWWLPAGLFWFLSLLSKESALVGVLWMPVLLLAHGERDRLRPMLRPAAAMAVMTLAYLAIRAIGPGFHRPLAERPPGEFASGAVLVGRVLLADVRRILWPVRLTHTPPLWVVEAGHAWTGIAGVVLGLLAAGASYFALRRTTTRPGLRGIATGTLLCLAALLPVIQILPTNDIHGGRFLYLPAAGFCLGLGLAFAGRRRDQGASVPASRLRVAARVGLIAILVALSVRTGLRAAEWRNDETLIGNEHRRQSEGAQAEILWAGYLLNVGRTEDARPVVERLASKHPTDLSVRYLRALVLMNSGQVEEAAATFEDLARAGRSTPTLLSNLASCQMRLGRLHEGLATLDRATEHLTPTPGMRNNRGLALKLLGRHDEARIEFARAIAEDPAYEPARVNLISLLTLDRPDPPVARREAEDFLRQFPRSPRALIVQGLLDSLRLREGGDVRKD
jgi:tetratricopeptide (TPR) repeat protein